MLTPEEIAKLPREHMDYLGDGAYALFDGYHVWLHANSHIDPTDRVGLEPRALDNLIKFVERMKERHGSG